MRLWLYRRFQGDSIPKIRHFHGSQIFLVKSRTFSKKQFSFFRRSSIIKLPEKTVEEEKLNQLSLDAEKIMDELLVAPSPSRAKGKISRRRSLIPELDNVVSSDSDSDSSSTDSDVSVSRKDSVKKRERRLKPRSNKHRTSSRQSSRRGSVSGRFCIGVPPWRYLELVSKELNHFGVLADLFRQIWGHSSRFVLFCSF